MKLVKCPRCDLNYIKEDEKYCKVCLRELKGEQNAEEPELCSICNEAPALPGRDMCLLCLKEMTGASHSGDNDGAEAVDENALGINPVSAMDEIIPEISEDIPEREFGEIESELSSLESIREDEDEDEDEDDEL
jgi:hypothetical protein